MWPYKGLYWHISGSGLGQEQTVRGGQNCWFFRMLILPAVVVHAVKRLSDYRFTAKDCEESNSA